MRVRPPDIPGVPWAPVGPVAPVLEAEPGVPVGPVAPVGPLIPSRFTLYVAEPPNDPAMFRIPLTVMAPEPEL